MTAYLADGAVPGGRAFVFTTTDPSLDGGPIGARVEFLRHAGAGGWLGRETEDPGRYHVGLTRREAAALGCRVVARSADAFVCATWEEFRFRHPDLAAALAVARG